MKKILLTCFAGAALLSAQAQLFSPDSITGAGLGAMIGGISGGNCHNGGFSGNDAAIGAGVGLLAGTLMGEARRQSTSDSPGYAYAPAPASSVSLGYGYGHCGSSAYVYYSPNYYTAPGYYYRPTAQPAPAPVYQSQRPNYAVGGTLLGAASGALIGSGIHHQAWQGAAIGAGAGLVLGGAAEYATHKQQQKAAKVQTMAQYQAQQPTATTQDAGIQPQDSQSQITSTPGPTSTYHWTTPPPQIPNAPLVPDAPRF